ncbi:MAG: ComF family protein [Clostridia bacterium]|nr:ComF family protein [Clostridia bacterium]
MFKSLISAFFPNTCVSCGEIIDQNEFLCDYCYCMLEQCARDKLCLKCGLPKKNCMCKYDVYSFDGVVAPFYKDTSAKDAMYSFKFRGNLGAVKFFAERMALAVKQYYSDINFDMVCCVPMTYFAQNKRGYNQSALLGEQIAEIFNLPFYKNLLYCKNKKSSQHKLSLKERKVNVKDVFDTNARLNGQTVLLVDDIKTTGATLSECAKVLLSSGADKVYCVTGLITRKKGKKDGNRNRN